MQRSGHIDTERGATAGGKGAPQSQPAGRAPTRVATKRHVTGPNASRVDEDSGAEVQHFARRPADVDAVLGIHNHATTAWKTIVAIATQISFAAKCELKWRPRIPGTGSGRAQHEGVARQRRRFHI